MKRMKKLEGGFTLVELIVVMAMMVIVFGALMQVITPTNIFFNESEAFKDQIMLSQGITNAVESEIRYATNVVVLEDYVGVPDIGANNQFANLENVELDSAIMLDNEHIRGMCLYDYDADAKVNRRKGAKGEIIRFGLEGAGVDFLNCDMIYEEDYYSDYEYIFTAAGGVDENGLGYVDFEVSMSDYVLRNGAYEYGEDPYSSRQYLYLKNINLKDNDGYSIYTYKFNSSVDDDDYIMFPRAAVDTTLTALQQEYFVKDDANNAHTWIFYYKGKPISTAGNVTITYEANGGGTDKTVSVKAGKYIKAEPPVFPETGYEETTGDDGRVWVRKFKNWLCVTDNQEYSSEEVMKYVPMGDETFVAQYELVDMYYDVVFFDAYGNEISNQQVHHGDPATLPPTSAISVPAEYDGYYWQYIGSDGERIPDSEFGYVTGNITAEPYFYKGVTVRFLDEDGTVLSEVHTISGSDIEMPTVPTKNGYSSKWVLKSTGAALKESDLKNVTTNFDVIVEYTEITEEVTIYYYGENEWGSPVSTQTVKKGSAVTPKAIPAKAGYIGKYLIVGGNGAEPNWNKVDTDLRVYIRYTEDTSNRVTIKYYDENKNYLGNSGYFDQVIAKGQSVQPHNVPDKWGYIGEWVTVDGSKANFTNLTEDLNVYAKYTKKCTVKFQYYENWNYYTITEMTVTEGTVISAPDVAKDGYSHKFVYKNDQNTEFDFSKPIVNDTEILVVYTRVYSGEPDLYISGLSVTGSEISITVMNGGTAPANGFTIRLPFGSTNCGGVWTWPNQQATIDAKSNEILIHVTYELLPGSTATGTIYFWDGSDHRGTFSIDDVTVTVD